MLTDQELMERQGVAFVAPFRDFLWTTSGDCDVIARHQRSLPVVSLLASIDSGYRSTNTENTQEEEEQEEETAARHVSVFISLDALNCPPLHTASDVTVT